jgi:hypothetical protein
MQKNILIIIIFFAILLIVVDLVKSEKTCPQNKIIYRFIPRTLEEEQNSPAYATDVFNVMLSQPDPLIRSIDNMTLNKRENINQFFISQV